MSLYLNAHFVGMVSALDEAVGKITAAIVSKGLMDNSIIVFTTDVSILLYY